MRHLRQTRAWTTGATTLLSVAALMLVANLATGAQTTVLDIDEFCSPKSHKFKTFIDNPFFPLSLHRQWVLVGKEGSQQLALQITVLDGTEAFYQGQSTVPTVFTLRIEEKEWEDTNGNGMLEPGEFVIETSINFFAQTREGTVCYFGEDVNIFSPDGSVDHAGFWRADDPSNTNKPGIFMPPEAQIQVNTTFAQEFAPGVAEDQVTIVSIGETVVTPAGTFPPPQTLGVRELNPLDHKHDTKAYARGVGLIQDETLFLLRVSD